jgi:hypothetical protein
MSSHVLKLFKPVVSWGSTAAIGAGLGLIESVNLRRRDWEIELDSKGRVIEQYGGKPRMLSGFLRTIAAGAAGIGLSVAFGLDPSHWPLIGTLFGDAGPKVAAFVTGYGLGVASNMLEYAGTAVFAKLGHEESIGKLAAFFYGNAQAVVHPPALPPGTVRDWSSGAEIKHRAFGNAD